MPRNKPIDRLFKRVKVAENGCWEWVGSKRPDGYGVAWLNGQKERAHRAFYALLVAPVPAQAVVCHSCDNRICVNPQHLFVGDRNINNQDCVAKQRHAFGEKNGRAKISAAQASEIKYSTESQAFVAKKFGVNQSTVSRIRAGQRRSLELLGAL